jgi:hypothetical protein
MADTSELDQALAAANGQQTTSSQNIGGTGNTADLDAELAAQNQGGNGQQSQNNMGSATDALSQLHDQQGDHGQRMAAIAQAGDAIHNNALQSMGSFLDTFNNQISKFPNGVIQMLGYGDWKPNANSISANEQIANNEAAAALARKNDPKSALAGDIIGGVGNMVNTYALTPLRGLGMMGGAAKGLEAGLTQATDPNGSHIANGINGALIGGAAGGLVDAVSSLAGEGNNAGQLTKMLKPEGAAANDVNNVVQGKQGLQDALNSFIPGGKDAAHDAIQQGYENLKNVTLPVAPDGTSALDSLKSNPTISKYLDDINSPDSMSALKNLPDNSFAKLDAIKQDIDSSLYKNNTNPTAGGMRDLKSGERDSLMDARNQIIDTLTSEGQNQGVDYAGLRKASQLEQLYNTYAQTLNKMPNATGAAPDAAAGGLVQNHSADQLFNTIAGSELKKNTFIAAVQNAGGNSTNARGLIDTLANLRGNSVDNLVKQSVSPSAGDAGILSGKGGITERLLDVFKEKFMSGNYNEAVLKLATSGADMQNNLAQALSQSSSAQRLIGVGKLLDSIGSSRLPPSAIAPAATEYKQYKTENPGTDVTQP